MMLENSVAEDFSHMKNRKTCCILQSSQGKDDSTGKIERSII